MNRSEKLFERAAAVIPGGVNSPVRAFGNVGMPPLFIKSADGAYITDADGMRYLDYVGSWGPMILGHNHPLIRQAVEKTLKDGLSFGAATENEVIMAELICGMVPNVEMVRMVNSGTEAAMSAVRLARGYTHKDKIIKFEGCYHGHSDGLLVKAGSGVMTQGESDSAGVTRNTASDTLSAAYNDIESVRLLFEANEGNIAAVILEPVAANMGVVPPRGDFLRQLKDLCGKYNALLIFDEVITGFRLSGGGAQRFFGTAADIVVMGKIIGGGLPVGAYGARREIMERVAPLGSVYQAGTLSGNPVAMAAGIAQLNLLRSQPQVYDTLQKLGGMLFDGMRRIISKYGSDCSVNAAGSLGTLFFTSHSVSGYRSAKKADTSRFADFFKYMLKHHVYMAPSQFEAAFVSCAHTEEDIGRTLELTENYFAEF